jgi:hypothetical protein
VNSKSSFDQGGNRRAIDQPTFDGMSQSDST